MLYLSTLNLSSFGSCLIHFLANQNTGTRTNGYALLEQQIAQRVRGIAVPIRTHEGVVVGSISVSLPMGNETTENAVARALPMLREAEYALLVAF